MRLPPQFSRTPIGHDSILPRCWKLKLPFQELGTSLLGEFLNRVTKRGAWRHRVMLFQKRQQHRLILLAELTEHPNESFMNQVMG